MLQKSAVNFIWTAIIERTRITYAERAYRYIYLDCGHLGQNFYLAAEALGLNACVVGAYYDDEITEKAIMNANLIFDRIRPIFIVEENKNGEEENAEND